MTLYQQALIIVNYSPPETSIPTPTRLPLFRKYLSTLAAAQNKKFTTKVKGNKLIIKQYSQV